MNGQIYQLARLTAFLKKRIEGGNEGFPLSAYEHCLEFSFHGDGEPAGSAEAWADALNRRQVRTAFMLIRQADSKPELAGFANAEPMGIVTIYPDGAVTFWTPHWDFDQQAKHWNITYTEHLWEQAPAEPPVFEDPTEELKNVLTGIESLAHRIGFDHFAKLFREAHDLLTGEVSAKPADWMNGTIWEMPEHSLRLFLAASAADVFGGMGSWNDSPPYAAEQEGLGREYEELTGALFRLIRSAVLYAVNET